MSNYRKAVRRRAHPERAQPTSRQHMGLLEKHSDYVLRARNYHSKQDRLNQLREAARLRNPDEFYHRMERDGEGVKDGRHVIERKAVKRSGAQLKRMKEQDFNYAVMQQQHEQHRIQRITQSLQGLGDSLPPPRPHNGKDGEEAAEDDEEEEEEDEDQSPPVSTQRRHVIFTESMPPSSFSPAAHFQTDPSLVSRAYNRPTLAQLSSAPLTVNVSPEASLLAVENARRRTYAELQAVVERAGEVDAEVQRLLRQRTLMGKGRRKKLVVKDKFGDVDDSKTVFVWKQQRKK